MSRIGKQPVAIPSGVTVAVKDGQVSVKGPKGALARTIPSSLGVKIEDGKVLVEKLGTSKQAGMDYGTLRAHIANMVKGVTEGFRRTLLIEGVGYRAQASKSAVSMTLGFSHPIEYPLPAGITVETPEPTKVIVSGTDCEIVGRVAMELRNFRPPEPYKGKGVRYENERVRRKAGKAAGK